MVRKPEMRRGYTTGACAQAATRAAALTVLIGYPPCNPEAAEEAGMVCETRGLVDVILPNGENAIFPMTMHDEGVVSVVKDAGDDPDITNGVQIFVCVVGRLDGQFLVDGAEGVGRVTLEGLPVPPGEAAINPVPMEFIIREAKRVLPLGAEVTISIPEGEELASKTFNPKLGILGGLSILGTTGRVEPWSSAAYQESLLPQLDVARAAGVERPVLVPGAKGERAALAAGYEPASIVQTGNYAGMMLAAARERSYSKVVLLGHASKTAKMARGDFDMHSKRSPMPLDLLAECAEAAGWSRSRAQALLALPTTEAALQRLVADGKEGRAALDEAAQRVAVAVKQEYGIAAEVVLTDGHGNIVGRNK
ncbi:MAG: cobalt-precorrin-5B (C(1))-methyltransferase CbiD [Thermoleophilia bacterium]|nr:cobalt-precorrin-5B (C(1))-methyltransferase CbiD [Thermoleophilia bacterium]